MHDNPAALAARLNLRRVAPDSWRGTCPVCGYASDAFGLKSVEGRTLWHCASCNDGVAIGRALRDALGSDWTPPPAKAPTRSIMASAAEKTARALGLWHEATLLEGSPAENYLKARGVLAALYAFAQPEVSVLRYHRGVSHPEAQGRHPAMLALMTGPANGQPCGAHRIFLKSDGSGKANLSPTKASIGLVGVIHLHRHQPGLPLVIAEGVETALAASVILGAPAWAAVSCGGLERLALPPEVQHVLVAADHDKPGQDAAWAAARRWRSEGRKVEIATPDRGGEDFNDLLAQRGERANG